MGRSLISIPLFLIKTLIDNDARMAKHYKAVFIDWDDTIGDFRHAAQQALRAVFTEYELTAYYDTFEQFYDLYHQHNIELWGLYGVDKVTKEYLSFDRFFYPIMMAPRPPKAEEAIAKALPLSREFAQRTTDYFALLPDAAEVVRALAARYPLTVLSNGFVEVQYQKVNKSGLADCFRHVVLSEEVGVQKPNPLIFQRAMELNGVQPDEVVMIGDSWTSDIQGAIAAGIDQLWVHGDDDKTDLSLPATYKVAHLKDVLPILL